MLHGTLENNCSDRVHACNNGNIKWEANINMILDRGITHLQSRLTTKKYIKMAKTTSATASRDIKGLLELGCIKQAEGTAGRNVWYLVLV